MVGSIFLIPPVTSLIAGLYIDDIAAEVERTNFPADPPGKELATLPSVLLTLKFFFVVFAVNILALFLLLVPGVNLIAFYFGNGYLLGREYFELAAMRHMPAAEAKQLRQGESRDRAVVRADHCRNCFGADPELDYTALRHGLHGAHLQAARPRRRRGVAPRPAV